MRRVPQPLPNRNVRRERDPRASKRQALLLLCGLMAAIGFAVAAGQQLSAVRHGYRSEELRREHERLEDEQRRLLLKLEETASPAQLERAALELGLRPARPAQIGVKVEDVESHRRGNASAFVGSAAATALRR